MKKIDISNINSGRRIQASEIKSLARYCAGRFFRGRDYEINIVFVSNRYIRGLNKKYKKKDRPTDVLCFNFFDDTSIQKGRIPLKADIFISTDQAAVNAREFGTDIGREVKLYVIHGILHMCGYKDHPVSERKKMNRVQEKELAEYEK